MPSNIEKKILIISNPSFMERISFLNNSIGNETLNTFQNLCHFNSEDKEYLNKLLIAVSSSCSTLIFFGGEATNKTAFIFSIMSLLSQRQKA